MGLTRIVFLLFCVLFAGTMNAQKVKVISFNIRYATENDGNNQWALRKPAVVNFVTYESPDFMGLQEALRSQIGDMEDEIPGYRWIGVGRDDGSDAGEFSPLFYRPDIWELLDSNTFWLSETPETPSKSWDAALPRICTWGKFRHLTESVEVFVFNTHYDHIGQEARRQSSSLIMKKIREIAGDFPVILTGDFNVEPDTEVVRILTKTLQDVYASARVRYGEKGTFNGFRLDKIPTRRIDYIFVSPDLRVISYKAESTVIDGRYLSDHFPVIITLRFP